MIEHFNAVLALQPAFSSLNTPEMRERGSLVRHGIPSDLREILPEIKAVMGDVGTDLAVEARDGTGRKSEVPWVRIHSQERSPTAPHGWYCVFLFAGDGSGFYLTVGHGSTRYEDGQYKPRSEAELATHVAWARAQLATEIGTDPGLVTRPDLQASKSGVADSYQRATAVSRWFPRESPLTDGELKAELLRFSRMLAKIYRAEDLGRDPDSALQLVEEHLATVSPTGRRGRGQGRGLSQPEKDEVERHSMAVAKEFLAGNGFTDIENTSSAHPFDFRAQKGGAAHLVEVKGTTGIGELVLLTTGEVKAQRGAHPHSALLVVRNIDLDRSGPSPRASGGDVVFRSPWFPEEAKLTPLTYSYDLSE